MSLRGLAVVSFYFCSFAALILLTLVLTFAPPVKPPMLADFALYMPGQMLTDEVKSTLTEFRDMHYSFYTSNYLYYSGHRDGWYVYVTAVNDTISYAGLYCRDNCSLLLGDVLQEYDFPTQIQVMKKTCNYTFGVSVRVSTRCGGMARAHDWRLTVTSLQLVMETGMP